MRSASVACVARPSLPRAARDAQLAMLNKSIECRAKRRFGKFEPEETMAYQAYDVEQLLNDAKTDFDTALNAARTALSTAPSPFMANLVRALGNYNRATTDVLLAILQRVDDVNRNVNGVAMRLDGKPGPYNLKMR
jgi:hypothetical protein